MFIKNSFGGQKLLDEVEARIAQVHEAAAKEQPVSLSKLISSMEPDDQVFTAKRSKVRCSFEAAMCESVFHAGQCVFQGN